MKLFKNLAFSFITTCTLAFQPISPTIPAHYAEQRAQKLGSRIATFMYRHWKPLAGITAIGLGTAGWYWYFYKNRFQQPLKITSQNNPNTYPNNIHQETHNDQTNDKKIIPYSEDAVRNSSNPSQNQTNLIEYTPQNTSALQSTNPFITVTEKEDAPDTLKFLIQGNSIDPKTNNSNFFNSVIKKNKYSHNKNSKIFNDLLQNLNYLQIKYGKPVINLFISNNDLETLKSFIQGKPIDSETYQSLFNSASIKYGNQNISIIFAYPRQNLKNLKIHQKTLEINPKTLYNDQNNDKKIIPYSEDAVRNSSNNPSQNQTKLIEYNSQLKPIIPSITVIEKDDAPVKTLTDILKADDLEEFKKYLQENNNFLSSQTVKSIIFNEALKILQFSIQEKKLDMKSLLVSAASIKYDKKNSKVFDYLIKNLEDLKIHLDRFIIDTIIKNDDLDTLQYLIDSNAIDPHIYDYKELLMEAGSIKYDKKSSKILEYLLQNLKNLQIKPNTTVIDIIIKNDALIALQYFMKQFNNRDLLTSYHRLYNKKEAPKIYQYLIQDYSYREDEKLLSFVIETLIFLDDLENFKYMIEKYSINTKKYLLGDESLLERAKNYKQNKPNNSKILDYLQSVTIETKTYTPSKNTQTTQLNQSAVKFDESSIQSIIEKDDINNFQMLIEKKHIDLEKYNDAARIKLIEQVVHSDAQKISKCLIQGQELIKSIMKDDNSNLLKELIMKKHIDPQAYTNTSRLKLIHLAAEHNALQISKYLIQDLKMDIHAQTKEGDTPLHLAIRWSGKDLIEYLIESGAKKDIKNNRDKTPLEIISSKNNDFKKVKYLIETLKAAIQDDDTSILHYVASDKSSDAVTVAKYLIEKGARKDAKDFFHQIPAFYAKGKEMKELLKI